MNGTPAYYAAWIAFWVSGAIVLVVKILADAGVFS